MPTGRVTEVTALPQPQKYGMVVTITVKGWTTPCSKVQVNFGDGTVTPYTIASPYQLPLVVTHTYATAGLYTVVAMGQTGASGPCLGTISTPVEVTSGNVVVNGNFSQVDGNGNPVNWGIFSVGGPTHWWLPAPAGSGIMFYRTGNSTQAVVLQYTGLALPAGAPLEATFTMANTDTVRKRLQVLVHNDSFDDLSACSFWLDANQPPQAYTMRMHTTKAWTNATVAFYAADANPPSSQGAYHLNNVTLTYRPALSSAKTECVDPLVPTGGDTWGYTNLVYDADFVYGPPWWTFEGQEVRWVNPGPAEARAEFFRKNATPSPVIRQPGRDGAIAEDQRVQLTFELRNASLTRQRVNVTLQDTGGGGLAVCTFWIEPGPQKKLYAMTTYAATTWANPELVVSAVTAGTEATHGWLQFDTVVFRRTNRPMLGTECYEPGSFVLDASGFLIPDAPQAPAPMPEPEAAQAAYAAYAGSDERTDAGQRSSAEALDDVTFHAESLTASSGPLAASAPVRTDPLTVMIGGTSSGTVTSSPGGITCAGSTVSCTGWSAEGTTVTLTATPDAGLIFLGWTGACTGLGPCNVSVVGPKSVGATFGSPLEYYHLDVLGSVRMVTNAAGAVVKRHDYFAFGEDTAAMTGDPRRFTGKELDPETALQYFGARYYRNLWGRFTSVDPVISKAARIRPQLWNRYAYALNGPLRLVDLTGLEAEERVVSSIEDGSLDLGDWSDDYAWNADYQSTADRIAQTAMGYDGSTLWEYNTTKDNFGIGNKCNKFVYDVTKEAGAEALTRGSDGKMRAPTAAEWAHKATKIAGWKVLGKNEKPRRGDVAAYKLPGGRPGATGHSGIVVGIRADGVVESIAAHAERVGPVKTQFDPSQVPTVVFRRYGGG